MDSRSAYHEIGCIVHAVDSMKLIPQDSRAWEKKTQGLGLMSRDDWKYDEEWEKEEEESESRKPPSPEKQCANCLHWIPREAPSCSWCGRSFPGSDKDRG